MYAHLGGYNVVTLTDFSPEAYIAALKECADAGMECVIVDSITHEWEWCLQMQERLGGKYQDWAKVTPRHDAFKNAMLQSPCHIITTVRRKQDYDMYGHENEIPQKMQLCAIFCVQTHTNRINQKTTFIAECKT